MLMTEQRGQAVYSVHTANESKLDQSMKPVQEVRHEHRDPEPTDSSAA
jgi:hypothetical protein